MKEEIVYQPRIERTPEQLAEYRRALLTGLQKMSKKINERLGTKLLSDDGTVSRKNYGFPKEILKNHEDEIREREDYYIRRKLRLNKKAKITDEQRSWWEADDLKRVSNLMEMAEVFYFNKITNGKYMAASCTKYDDYNGNDTMIVNCTTGDVICAFDDIHDSTEDRLLEWRKEELQEKVNKKGGATITYGFTFEDGNLVKKEVSNAPKFYNKNDFRQLITLIEGMDFDPDSPATEKELEAYNRTIETFASQLETNKREGSEHPEYLKKLNAFESLLPELRSFGQQEYHQAA